MSRVNHAADEGWDDGRSEWAETKVAENKKLEEKVIRYALVFLHANWEEADAEDLEIDELVLDDTLRRLINSKPIVFFKERGE